MFMNHLSSFRSVLSIANWVVAAESKEWHEAPGTKWSKMLQMISFIASDKPISYLISSPQLPTSHLGAEVILQIPLFVAWCNEGQPLSEREGSIAQHWINFKNSAEGEKWLQQGPQAKSGMKRPSIDHQYPWCFSLQEMMVYSFVELSFHQPIPLGTRMSPSQP